MPLLPSGLLGQSCRSPGALPLSERAQGPGLYQIRPLQNPGTPARQGACIPVDRIVLRMAAVTPRRSRPVPDRRAYQSTQRRSLPPSEHRSTHPASPHLSHRTFSERCASSDVLRFRPVYGNADTWQSGAVEAGRPLAQPRRDGAKGRFPRPRACEEGTTPEPRRVRDTVIVNRPYERLGVDDGIGWTFAPRDRHGHAIHAVGR